MKILSNMLFYSYRDYQGEHGMQSVQDIRRKEFANKNFILFITLGASV